MRGGVYLSDVDSKERIKSGIEAKKSLTDVYAGLSGLMNKVDFYKTVLSLVEAGEIPNVLLCYCGHDCSKCRTFRATLLDDNDMRKSISEYYKSELKLDIPIEKLSCLSGRSDETMEGCLQCPYMKCGKEKNLSSCSECKQYPCRTLGWYIEKYVNKANQI